MKKLTYPFVLSLFWLVVIGYIFNTTLPVVSGGSFSQKVTLLNITPQGWGFFTKDPREEQLIVCKLKNDTPRRFTKTHSSSSSFFGLSRKNRFTAMEAANLAAQINDTLWNTMEGRKFILEKNAPTDTVINRIKPITIEGDFFFVKQERIPWAWAGNAIVMPYKYIKVYVQSDSQ